MRAAITDPPLDLAVPTAVEGDRPARAKSDGEARHVADAFLRRAFDVVASFGALVVLSPVLAVAALAVRLSSSGPVLYRARRVGRGGAIFTMYKLRTMPVGSDRGGPRISAGADPRVDAVGRLLRKTKIDELPQLVNVLAGQMSIVGPRPEDPEIVARYYAASHLETLEVRPGLTSPGSLFYYTTCEKRIGASDPEVDYLRLFLPTKLALDTVYVREASLVYDLRLAARTAWTLACVAAGRRELAEPPEMRRIGEVVATREPEHEERE